MRSKRDLAVIELKHLKTKINDAVTTQQNNDLEQQSTEASTSRGDEMSTKEEVLMLRIENEESKRKWSEASIRIAALSAEKIILVTRINDALDEARSTIALALNNDITNCNDGKNIAITDDTNHNNAHTVSFVETGHHLPRQDERVLDHSIDPPRPRKRSNDSPTTKSTRFSSSSSCSSHGSGRVSFDRSTRFGNTKLPKFDIFNDNFSSSRNNKKQKMKKKNTKLLSFGHKENGTTEDGGGDLQSNGGLVYTQSSTRRKKYSTSNAKGNGNSYLLDNFDDDQLY
jgi:hypothetical protein